MSVPSVPALGQQSPWSRAVAAFVAKLVGDNCTPATIETYSTFLDGGRARRFREAHEITSPAQLDVELLEAMKQEFRADGLRPATVADYVRMWITFARWFGVDVRVRGPRQPHVTPATFNESAQQELMAACRSERDRVMVQLMLATGLRRSEVANLEVDDVERRPTDWLIRVRQGKGRKDRAVPLAPAVGEQLASYIARTRPSDTKCRALFLTLARTDGGDYGGLTSNGIYQIWRRLSQATGIRAHPHKARHTAATRWAQTGISPWAIQHALGHTTPAMTARYVDASAVSLSQAFAEARGASGQDAGGDEELSLIGQILALVADRYGHGAAQELLETAGGVRAKVDSPPQRRRAVRARR